VGLLTVGIVALALAANVHWPARHRGALGGISFLFGALTCELAFHALFTLTLIVALLLRAGALATIAGQVGLGLSLAAAALLMISCVQSARCHTVIERVMGELPRTVEWGPLLLPIPMITPPDVERVANVVYYKDDSGWDLKLDVYRPRGQEGKARPALIYCHGGAWVAGHRSYLGRPIVHRMAARGWVCFNIQYRLSPRATHPDHIVDVKRAIAWVRAHAEEWGVDPSFIVLSGGSAGGHLAALAALTPHRLDWQPRFEKADTRVQACISCYCAYDMRDPSGSWSESLLPRLIERYYLKERRPEAEARIAEMSPAFHLGPEAPPFLVVHGTHDTIIPVETSREFLAVMGDRAVYLELPGAQHSFDTLPSLRTAALLDGLERFATRVYEQRASTGQATAQSLRL
jgi:acetyl esterase/lipase